MGGRGDGLYSFYLKSGGECRGRVRSLLIRRGKTYCLVRVRSKKKGQLGASRRGRGKRSQS